MNRRHNARRSRTAPRAGDLRSGRCGGQLFGGSPRKRTNTLCCLQNDFPARGTARRAPYRPQHSGADPDRGGRRPASTRAGEPLVEARDWTAVQNWWIDWHLANPDQNDALKELLAELKRLVPTISVENGMERWHRHIVNGDDQKRWSGIEHLRGAAKILVMGELEAAVEGMPPEASQAWADYRSVIEEHLIEYMERPESTEGAAELSRRAHAQEAIGLLEQVDFAGRSMAAEMESEEDRAWLHEVIGQVAHLAHVAGRHTQAAWGKEFEKHAKTRLKNIQSLADANFGRTDYKERRRSEAAVWREHATKIEESYCSSETSASGKAERILKQWDKIGDADTRPDPPAKKTIQNWLSTRDK